MTTAPQSQEPGSQLLAAPDDDLTALSEISTRHRERIRTHAARLFNDGLAAASRGDAPAARDLFAALAHWYPHDLEARNALALACLKSGDDAQARAQWEHVLTHRPSDPLAQRGILMLSEPQTAATPGDEPDVVSPTGP